MKYTKVAGQFDTRLEPSDWRYSAALVGLAKYLKFHEKNGVNYAIQEDYLEFHLTDITEEWYLEFVEAFYGNEFLHRQLEQLMYQEEWSKEQIKLANDLQKGNAIMKKVFGKMKFDGTNSKEILKCIESNRKALIRETFRNKSDMYSNFANTGQLFEEPKSCCRLLGYYVDGARKSRNISYRFDQNTFVSQDDSIFDFIPFAFSGDREVFFINANYSVKELIDVNIALEQRLKEEIQRTEGKSKDGRKVLFKSIQETADFLDYDVEVIVKDRDREFFETMYVRRESIKVLRGLGTYDPFCFSLQINGNYYINIQKKVTECILNLIRTDELIELFLKRNNEYLVTQFIKINQLICGGGEQMKQTMKMAYACAKEVARKLPENKRVSFRQKLTSSIIFKDYDRCCQILLNLSNYVDMPFEFVYGLFEDFEGNKDVAYTFINALTKKNEKSDGQEEK